MAKRIIERHRDVIVAELEAYDLSMAKSYDNMLESLAFWVEGEADGKDTSELRDVIAARIRSAMRPR